MHSDPAKPHVEELIGQQDAARLLSVSERTLEGWRHRGGGPPYVKLERAVRYRRCDLVAWIEAQTKASTSVGGRVS